MSKTQRELLSQNFLWNRKLVSKLVRSSSISQNDSVLEIGSGMGIITKQLLGVCRKLTAIEVDGQLHSYLKKRLPIDPNLSLLPCDFLDYQLPQSGPFKVFSNIPFSITGEIIKKLLLSQNPPLDSYLVVQKEAADKYVANVCRNTLVAVLFYPWFEIKIVHKFQRSDFKPTPRVDICLIRIEKRVSPLVDESQLRSYRDFIVYYFTRSKTATFRPPNVWLSLFDEFIKKNGYQAINEIHGSFDKWRTQERKLSKIHRTRTDKDWRNRNLTEIDRSS